MNSLDIGMAVIAVTTAFHAGADMMLDIRKRNLRKRKTENAALEKLVQDTLENAEAQVSGRYASHYHVMGDTYKHGDGECNMGIFVLLL
jgi:hypothetical protein